MKPSEIKIGQRLMFADFELLKQHNYDAERNCHDHYSQEFLDDLKAFVDSGELELVVSDVNATFFTIKVPKDSTFPLSSLWFNLHREAQFFKPYEPLDNVEVKCEELLDITPILHVSAEAPERTEHYVLAKLTEETGEIAKAINQPERADEAVSGEAADVIISVVDLVYLNLQNDERFKDVNASDLRCIVVDLLNKQIKKKSAKWASKVL